MSGHLSWPRVSQPRRVRAALLRGPLRHRPFSVFVGGVGLRSVGDEVARLALPLLVLDLTGSLAAAATLRVLQSVPYVLFGAFAGALIDRVDKRRLLLVTLLSGTALTAAIPLSVATGTFSLELLYAVAFLLGAIEVVWGVTADFSVVPSLVERAELTAANAAYLGADRAARIVGPTLGGLAIAGLGGGLSGSASALWIAVAMDLPVLAVLLRMPPLYDQGRAAPAALTAANVGREIGESFTFIWRSPILRALLVLMFVSNLGGAGIQTVLLFVLSQEYRLDAATIGLALSLTGIVQIAGSASAPLVARGRPLGQTMLAVVSVASLASAAAALARDWRLVVAAVGARQTAWAAHIVYVFLPRQREVPSALRGRVNGSFRTLVLLGNTASPALLSAIQATAGSPAAFAAAGALGLASVAITYFSPLRDYDIREAPRELETVEPEAEVEEATPAEV